MAVVPSDQRSFFVGGTGTGGQFEVHTTALTLFTRSARGGSRGHRQRPPGATGKAQLSARPEQVQRTKQFTGRLTAPRLELGPSSGYTGTGHRLGCCKCPWPAVHHDGKPLAPRVPVKGMVMLVALRRLAAIFVNFGASARASDSLAIYFKILPIFFKIQYCE